MRVGLSILFILLSLVQFYPVLVQSAETVPTVPEVIEQPSEVAKIENLTAAQQADAQASANNDQLLRAQIKARESTQVASEMSGRISHLKIRDGERFTAGQVLVGFHCSMEEAQLTKAKATLEKKRKTHDVDVKLEKLRSISTLQLDVSKAEEAEAKADVGVAQAVLEKCVIKAPFSGKVVDVTARAYQSVGPGDPLLEIVNEKDLEVEFIAPSKALPQLKSGKVFKVTLDETGKTYNAKIIRMGGRVDPVSQTIKVYGRITEDSAELLPGMSGAIQLPSAE